MANFSINQRVVLARPSNPINVGITGVIVKFGEWPKGTFGSNGQTSIDCDCAVEWDDNRGASLQHTSQLEPLIPKLEPGSWEEIQKLMVGEEEVEPA